MLRNDLEANQSTNNPSSEGNSFDRMKAAIVIGSIAVVARMQRGLLCIKL